MNHLNYHHLFYFKVIATEGSISKAAVKLRLGQPTLSMQLKQFEEQMGHSLFERKNRTLVLTEMGRLVLSYANEIFRMGDEMMDAVQDRPGPRKIRVQIGVLPSISKTTIKTLLERALSLGDCQLTVIEGEGRELVEELVNHRLDLVISNRPAPSLTTHKVYSRSFGKFPLIVCGAPKFSHLAAGFPKSLSGQPFILPTIHNQNRQDIDYFFEKTKIPISVIAEVHDSILMKMMAFDGRGLIFIAAPSVRFHLEAKRLVKIGELEDSYEELYLIAAQRKLQNPIADTLLKTFVINENEA